MITDIPQTVYLDNAATTFPKPECVYEYVDYIQRHLAVNSGRGEYALARTATQIIDEVRTSLSHLVRNDDPRQVILGPSDTYAANQIIMGLSWSSYSVVYISPYEHNAIVRPLWRMKEKYGFNVEILPIDNATQEIDLQAMEEKFKKNPPNYVFITHVSNVTGYILPIGEITKVAKSYGAVVIVDAAQSLGLVPMNNPELGADFVLFAGHKNLYGNFGIGGFFCKHSDLLSPCLSGGTGSDSLNHDMPTEIPGRFEAASPNILAIASLNASLKWLSDIGNSNIYAHKKRLTDYLVRQLQSIPSITLYVPSRTEHHIGVVSFNHSSYSANEVGMILDQDFGIAVRTGYHCAPFVHDVIGSLPSNGTVRASIGYFSKKEEIDALASALKNM